MINKDINITRDSKRIRPKRSEVDRLYADVDKAKKLLNWEPKISLDEGLKRTISWIRKNLSKYKAKKYQI